MTTIKSLVLASAAGCLATGGALAADLPVMAKAVEYVKACSSYGAGFFYMPGTETCIKFGGYMRADVAWNTNSVYNVSGGTTGARNRLSNDYTTRTRFSMDWDTRTATEYGVVRTFATILTTYTDGGVTAAPNPLTSVTALPAGVPNGATSSDAAPPYGQSTGPNVFQAFIQFAGFTIGRAYSIFDAPWQSYPAGGPDTAGASNHVTGANQLSYTASFGNGVSGSISLQDPTEKDSTNLWNLSNISASGFVGGSYGSNNQGGTRAPDVIGQVRVDQTWGLAQMAVAAHDNHVAYYGPTEVTGHPDDKWGFAVQGALSIKNIPTGPGDTINLTAVYTDGASAYTFQNLFPRTGVLYGGTDLATAFQSLAVFGVSDVTYTNGSGLESVKTWGFTGGYTHNWNPNWASAIYGSYGALQYGAKAQATICTFLRAAPRNLSGNCSPNFGVAMIGVNTVWTPVKNLAFTVDVNLTRLDQQYSGTITSSGSASFAKPGAVYELKDQNAVTARFRAQRNF